MSKRAADNMSKEDNIAVIRTQLAESLGDKYEEYRRILNKWFKMNATREQLEAEVNGLLDSHQKHLHHQLLLHLLRKCAGVQYVVAKTHRPKKRFRNCERIRKGFVPVDPLLVEVTQRTPVDADTPPFMVHEKMLPDVPTALARICYNSWEIGLQGSNATAAEFLVIATQHFLKNVITAVITRKKGYKRNKLGFIHDLGCATPNPWLYNVAKHKPEVFHPLEVEGVLKVVRPVERPSKDERENEAIFRLAASSCDKDAGPISLYDLILTLQIYPGLIASNFVRVVNTERIYARLCHPVLD